MSSTARSPSSPAAAPAWDALDRDKPAEFSDLYQALGGYPYDRDPARPDWFPLVPNTRWADPRDDRPVRY